MVRRGPSLMVVCALFTACAFEPSGFPGATPDSGAPTDSPGPTADAPEGAPDADSIDATWGIPDASPPPDARPDAMPPLPDAAVDLGPFSPPVLMDFWTYDNDDDPTLTGDLLEIYFDSDRAGGLGGGEIWRHTRPTVFDPWGAAEAVTALSSSSTETTPEISPDGLTIYFASGRPGGSGGTDIYRATRLSRSADFDSPVRVAELCSANNDFAATPSATGLILYMGSDRPGVGGLDIYRTTRAFPGGTFAAPALVGGVNSLDTESDSWVDASDLVMYFDSNRAGGEGSRDLWVMERPSPSGDFAGATPLTELNGPDYDADPWLSADQRTIVFASDRFGDFDLFIATR